MGVGEEEEVKVGRTFVQDVRGDFFEDPLGKYGGSTTE